MEIQEILHNIIQQEECSSVYALYLLLNIQDALRREQQDGICELQQE